MKKTIGKLKTKVFVYCEICGCKHTRNIIENVYEDTEAEKERAIKIIKTKAAKPYTCSICKSIVKNNF